MALLKREEWQGFVRDVDWSYRYVDDEAVYPEWHSGTGKVPRAAWAAWEESYKVSYPEYVATQREKEAAAYAVKGALQRSKVWDPHRTGWARPHRGLPGRLAVGAALAARRYHRQRPRAATRHRLRPALMTGPRPCWCPTGAPIRRA
jgi:Methane/Phenol/Alkene Hydroxylase